MRSFCSLLLFSSIMEGLNSDSLQDKSGLRYVTYRNKETVNSGQTKDDRLWSFEPTGFSYADAASLFSEIAGTKCFSFQLW